MFSIYDVITKDAPDYVSDEGYIKLLTPGSSSNHELTAATQTQTEKYFSIYDTISLV